MKLFYYNGAEYEKIARSLYIWQGTLDGPGYKRIVYKRRISQPRPRWPGRASKFVTEPNHCGKHVKGTCTGYGTECSPRHTESEILAASRRTSKPV